MNTEQYSNIPPQLRQLKRWTGHTAKKPVNPFTGNPAQSNNPDTWGTFEEAVAAVETYTEKSLSGTGVHMYFAGAIDEAGAIYKKNPKNGVEIYSSGRPFVITGNAVGEFSTVENRTEQVKAIQQKYMQ